MAWAIFDYIGPQGVNEFLEWSAKLQKPELAKLNFKIDMLEEHGPGLAPKILAGPLKGEKHIYKLTINGKIALRPLLCKGPAEPDSEFTMLMGAFEVGNEWKPPGAPGSAEAKRKDVAKNPGMRRCQHEHCTR